MQLKNIRLLSNIVVYSRILEDGFLVFTVKKSSSISYIIEKVFLLCLNEARRELSFFWQRTVQFVGFFFNIAKVADPFVMKRKQSGKSILVFIVYPFFIISL